ncbi:MAG: four helix bundle protein [Anaerolineae bacterium]|nr:four helix bundle protein [Anaerolineae bacterium]
MRDYHKWAVWEKAHQLNLDVYRATKSFPNEELYGLTSQTRRAAHSIPANIVEGAGRSSDADCARFMDIAVGSANELEYHLLVTRDLDMLSGAVHADLTARIREIRMMLAAFIARLRKS